MDKNKPASKLNEGSRIVRNASILIEQGKYKSAIDILKSASEHYQDDPYVWGNLGLAYAKSGKTNLAIELYKKALRLDPSLNTMHLNLSTALSKMSRLPEAIEEATRAIEIDPLSSDAYYQLGWLEQNRSAYHASLVSLEKTLELNPGHTDAMEIAGKAYLYIGDYEEARRMFTKALQSGTKDRKPWYGIAIVEFATGHWFSAIRALIKYVVGV